MNLRKEIPDQAAHFTWAALSIYLVVAGARHFAAGATWGLLVLLLGGFSLVAIVEREIRQKADKPGGILWNWPWLDSIFYVLGGAAAGVGIGIGFL